MDFSGAKRWMQTITATLKRDGTIKGSPVFLSTPVEHPRIFGHFRLGSSDCSSSPPASPSSSSSDFWQSPHAPSVWSPRRYIPAHVRNSITKRQLAAISCLILTFVVWTVPSPSAWKKREVHVGLTEPVTSPYHVLGSFSSLTHNTFTDPQRWLRENSGYKHAVLGERGLLDSIKDIGHTSLRPRAAIVSLVRNSELQGLMSSMRQLEYRWNRNYQYPWVFFNEEPFTDEFKQATQNLTSAKCYYEIVPKEHWSLPDWIDEGRFMNSLEYLGAIGVGKGWMISYRHMCRWNSGFFYRHPRLKDFDWYWRVEPDVHYYCDIDYDVFRFMAANNLKYGFNINILDDARSFPSLWSRTRSFINNHPELIHPRADLDWLLDPQNSGDYNNCQFFSNFEIGNLNFFRSESYQKYFEWLDRGGGFFYERFGDAPIHTLGVSMFVPKDEIWYFRDIGYQHDINRHCPPHSSHRCACEPTLLDENFYKLVPIESPQKKPDDTCIRQFLGGEWLAKKEGWTAEGERMFGGSGFGGYVRSGLEVDELGG